MKKLLIFIGFVILVIGSGLAFRNHFRNYYRSTRCWSILGCEEGIIGVAFVRGITQEKAIAVLESFNLDSNQVPNKEHLERNDYRLYINVPPGKEKFYIVELRKSDEVVNTAFISKGIPGLF